MRQFALLPLLAFAFLPLQGCSYVYTDQLLRSTSSMALPVGLVHVPPSDSDVVAQGSLTLTGNSGQRILTPGTITSSNGLYTVGTELHSLDNAVGMRTFPIQVAAEGSLFLTDHLRLGGGVDASPYGWAPWGEIGVRWGHQVSVEMFVAGGETWVSSKEIWNTGAPLGQSYSSDYIHSDTDIVARNRSGMQRFVRFGTHVGTRGSGPFGEAQVLDLHLLDPSPKSGVLAGTAGILLGTGWTWKTTQGDLIGYLRGYWTGDAPFPMLGVQWTGELKRSR